MSGNHCFIDIHALQVVPPSCVNRDDTGSPKSCIYGGVPRARISSQCWKRAARELFPEKYMGVRTLKVPAMVRDRIMELSVAGGKPLTEEQAAKKATMVLKSAGVVKAKKDKDGKDAPVTEDTIDPVDKLDAAMFLSWFQADALARQALAAPGDKAAAVRALSEGITADIAMFGRMVAANPSLNVDACVQVAQAVSTHAVHTEYDYFTAKDEMNTAAETGAGHVNTSEFNSATVYRYACVDMGGLRRALGDEAVEAAVTFARCFLTSMPRGHVNAFANFTLPGYIRVCVRDDMPMSFVGAFDTPVKSPDGGFMDKSVEALERYASDLRAKYGGDPILDTGFWDGSLDTVLSKLADAVSVQAVDGGVVK